MHFDGNPLTTNQLNQVLKRCILAAGLNVNDFSPHSFRIGAAISASMCGISEENTKRLGRWKVLVSMRTWFIGDSFIAHAGKFQEQLRGNGRTVSWKGLRGVCIAGLGSRLHFH